jgi:hypothetical protein
VAVVGYVNTEVMPHMLDKERSSKLILSTTDMDLAVVALAHSIILIPLFSYQYSILTCERMVENNREREV